MMKYGLLLYALWSMPLLNKPPVMDKLFSKRQKPQLVFCSLVATVALQLAGVERLEKLNPSHAINLEQMRGALRKSQCSEKKI